MDKKTRIRLGLEKYESEKIHNEIFQNSTNHQYYILGVAQGLYFLYKTMDNVSVTTPSFSKEDIMQIIKYTIDHNDNDKLKTYFNRLLLDLDV